MAHAHICAERALASEGTVAEKAAGQVFQHYMYSTEIKMREREREISFFFFVA